MDVSNGYYYTFHLAGDYSWGNRSYVVMKTTYQPSTILNVEDDSEWACEEDVTLTVNCSVGTAEQISPELGGDRPRGNGASVDGEQFVPAGRGAFREFRPLHLP